LCLELLAERAADGVWQLQQLTVRISDLSTFIILAVNTQQFVIHRRVGICTLNVQTTLQS